MNRRHSLPLAALVLGLDLGLGCATGAGPADSSLGDGAGRRPVDADLLAAVPADAEVLVEIDMAQLRDSPWSRDLLSGRDAPAARGFDELSDVDRVVFARLASTGESASLTLAQGRFDRDRVVTAFHRDRPPVAPMQIRGCAVWSHEGEALAFLTPRTVLSGPLAAVRGSIDAAFGRAAGARNEAWLARLVDALEEDAPSRAPAATLAVQVTESVRQRLRRELAEAEGLDHLAARLDLGPTLELRAVGVARGRNEAAALAARVNTLMRGLPARVSLAALGLSPVLEGARVGSRGPRVEGHLRLHNRQREQIAARLAVLARAIEAQRSRAAEERGERTE